MSFRKPTYKFVFFCLSDDDDDVPSKPETTGPAKSNSTEFIQPKACVPLASANLPATNIRTDITFMEDILEKCKFYLEGAPSGEHLMSKLNSGFDMFNCSSINDTLITCANANFLRSVSSFRQCSPKKKKKKTGRYINYLLMPNEMVIDLLKIIKFDTNSPHFLFRN